MTDDDNPEPETIYCYATSEEGPYQHDGLTSRESAIQEAIHLHGYDDGEYTTIYTGKVVPVTISRFLPSIEQMLERMSEYAYEDGGGEPTETWLSDLNQDQIDDLEYILGEALEEWAYKHGHQPNFYLVEDVVEHEINADVDVE